MKRHATEPDYYRVTNDPKDERARHRWVEEQRRRSRIAGCTYATAAITECPDGDLLVLAAWQTNPELLG